MRKGGESLGFPQAGHSTCEGEVVVHGCRERGAAFLLPQAWLRAGRGHAASGIHLGLAQPRWIFGTCHIPATLLGSQPRGLQHSLCCRTGSKISHARPGQQKVVFHGLSADSAVEELGSGANSSAAANEEKSEEMLVPHLALLKLNKYFFFLINPFTASVKF